MRIEDHLRIFQIYNQNKRINKIEKGKDISNIDKIEISKEAKEFQAILNALNKTSDIRSEKVEDIKNRIENNTYNVTAKDVINKLIEEYKNEK